MSKYKKTRAECALEASEAADGTYVSGHLFEPVIAFEDEKTARYYYVDRCEKCGMPEVGFVEAHNSFAETMKEEYPVFKQIGRDLLPGEEPDFIETREGK